MSKLHYCSNGTSVTEQVIIYQRSRNMNDFLPIQSYYEHFKDHWYSQVEDYLDRNTFNSEFDYRLCKAVESFKVETADNIARKMGYTRLGAFNGWFYKILVNWKSNIKTSSFRLKSRPSVQCPVCHRYVPRIDAIHLEHFKNISDLPKYFVFKNEIFETSVMPRVNAISWGEKTNEKWKALQHADTKIYTKDRKRVAWPWRLPDGTKGVMCPFMKKVIPLITVDYIRTLSDKHSRYANPVSWEYFVEQFPASLIQSEVYSLDHAVFDQQSDSVALHDHVCFNNRVKQTHYGFDYNQLCSGVVPFEFEHSFAIIDKNCSDETDRDVLKLVAVGYTFDDIADTLELDKKEVRRRVRNVKSGMESLVNLLVD